MTSPREEWSLATRRLGRRVLVFDRLDSTNTLAASLANDPANAGLAILADEQTAGRGQHGRTWLAAPAQSVLLSLVIAPPPELCRPAVLTAWAAVAVCAVIQQTIAQPPRIKWPNDVLLNERKVCGILIESGNPKSEIRNPNEIPITKKKIQNNPARPFEISNLELENSFGFRISDFGFRFFVVGIGLNVQQSAATFAAAGLPEATSLSQFTTHPLDTHILAADLIRQLDRDYDALCQGDLATLETRWQHHLGLLGKPVVAECADAKHHGRLVGLSFRGVELARPGVSSLVLVPERIQHLWEADEEDRGGGSF